MWPWSEDQTYLQAGRTLPPGRGASGRRYWSITNERGAHYASAPLHLYRQLTCQATSDIMRTLVRPSGRGGRRGGGIDLYTRMNN